MNGINAIELNPVEAAIISQLRSVQYGSITIRVEKSRVVKINKDESISIEEVLRQAK